MPMSAALSIVREQPMAAQRGRTLGANGAACERTDRTSSISFAFISGDSDTASKVTCRQAMMRRKTALSCVSRTIRPRDAPSTMTVTRRSGSISFVLRTTCVFASASMSMACAICAWICANRWLARADSFGKFMTLRIVGAGGRSFMLLAIVNASSAPSLVTRQIRMPASMRACIASIAPFCTRSSKATTPIGSKSRSTSSASVFNNRSRSVSDAFAS
mmetsp:Transcript_134117/g.236519  ORF Transcript_134117/g.236519 Transcript_134117/m.236519 type:complete len:218 (-) Transcript_134117:503-1156(-)